MNILKNAVAVLCAGLLLFSLNVFHEPKLIDFPTEIIANAATQTHDISEGDVVINDSDAHIITGTTTQYKVIVESGNPTITIENLNIILYGDNQCPFEIRSNCTIVLSGENTLICTNQERGRAGLWINNSRAIIEGSGSLYAEGAGNWAGICVWTYTGDSELIINSGKITAKGGTDGAGIGGSNGDGGYITINGGTIEAYGGEYGAGIGGGSEGTNREITINGGNITAVKGSSANDDIGAGRNADKTGAVKITGGIINGVNYNFSEFIVTIPTSVQLGNTANIEFSNVKLPTNERISISLSGEGNPFILTGNEGAEVSYTIRQGDENGADVNIGEEFFTTTENSTVSLYFTEPENILKYSGEYSGSVTFLIKLAPAE